MCVGLVLLRGLGRWTATKAAVAEAGVPPRMQEAAVERVYRKLVDELHRIQREGRTSAQRDLEAYDARLAAFQTAFPEAWAAIAAAGASVDLGASLCGGAFAADRRALSRSEAWGPEVPNIIGRELLGASVG